MNDKLTKVRKFVTGTIEEIGRCSWPKRDELFKTTMIVIIAVAVLSIFVAVVDFGCQKIVRLLTGF